MKKFFAILLSAMLMLSLAVPAMAAEKMYTITAPEGSNRAYDVYEIFTGDYDPTTGKLSNLVWGTNGKGEYNTAVTDDNLEALTALADSAETTVLATIERDYVNLDSVAIGEVKDGAPLTVNPGYYLIKDKGPVAAGESFSLYIIQVADDVKISPKVGTVSSDKAVKDTNDTTGDVSDWQEGADYDVKDTVPFKLTATLPADYDRYVNGYRLTFHDALSSGLTFNNDVKVKIGETDVNTGYEVVTTGLTDGCTFEVRFENLKTISAAVNSATITIEYTATMNENAVPGIEGNTNKSHVTYTNNPNDDQIGEGGKTPEDTVIVFTYNVIVNKIDVDEKPLEGAGFTLYKEVKGNWVAVGEEIKSDALTRFEFKQLDEGKYKLVETTTPAGYNTAEDIIFTVESAIENETLNDLIVKDVTGATVTDFTIAQNMSDISTNVVNKSGTILPETGGMGTTIFYIVGGVMVAAAVVLLVTKKRMSAEG